MVRDPVNRCCLLLFGQALTRSLTHSLVPTLTLGLSHDRRQDVWCSRCFHEKQYCSLCHYSPQSLYYTNYYSVCTHVHGRLLAWGPRDAWSISFVLPFPVPHMRSFILASVRLRVGQ